MSSCIILPVRDLPGCDFLLKGLQASSAPLSVLYVTESDFVDDNKQASDCYNCLYEWRYESL